MTATETHEPRSRKGGARRAKDKAKADAPPKSSTKNAYVAPLPKTNLLPQKYAKAAEKQTKFTQLGAAVGIAVVALVALFLAQSGQIAAANSGLHDAQSNLTSVTAKANDPKLIAASDFFSSVDTMVATAKSAMSGEILYSSLLASLGKDTPAGVSFTSLAFGSTSGTSAPSPSTPGVTTGGGSCPGPDPFNTTASVGCVTFSGTAKTSNAVNALLAAMNKDKRVFVNPFISSTGEGSAGTPGTTPAPGASSGSGAGNVSFSGTVNLAPYVMSGRYQTGAIFGATAPTSPTSPTTTVPKAGAVTGSNALSKAPPAADALAQSAKDAPSSTSMFSPMYLALYVLLLAALGGLLVVRKKEKEKKA